MLALRGKSIVLDGCVTLETVPALIEAAGDSLLQGVEEVDFSAVTDIDSSAVALSLEWLRQAAEANVSLRLVGLPEAMRNLAVLYGVMDLLDPRSA